MIKEKLETFLGFVIIILIIAYFYEDELSAKFLDPDAESVLKIHQKYNKNNISLPNFKKIIRQENTDLQRNTFIQKNTGTIVQWTGKVENLTKKRGYYIITLASEFMPENDLERGLSDSIKLFTGKKIGNRIESICGKVDIFPLNASDDNKIRNLVVGSNFRFEAVLDDVTGQNCIKAKFGLLSKDQTRLNDPGYKSELISNAIQAIEIVKDVAKEHINSELAKSSTLSNSNNSLPKNLMRSISDNNIRFSDYELHLKRDLNEDGKHDYIFRKDSPGSGGDYYLIFISNNEDYKNVYDDMAQHLEIIRDDENKNIIKFNLHGSACGLAGSETCIKSLKLNGF